MASDEFVLDTPIVREFARRRARTTSAETSVSIHLLTNDTCGVWRHAYEPESGEVRPFRSGYVNAPCADEPQDTERANGAI